MAKVLLELVEPKTLAILQTLLKNPDKIFHLNSLAKTSHVPISSTARIIKKLVTLQYAETVIVGKLTLYKQLDNQKTKTIKKLL